MKILFPLLLILFSAPTAHSQKINREEAEAFWVSTIYPIMDMDIPTALNNVNYPISTYLGNRTKEDFTGDYNDIFTPEILKALGKSSIDDIQIVDYQSGELTYMLVLMTVYKVEDDTDMEGSEMESATILSFKKFDGVWKLYNVDIAG
ncbi:MAG: hypothetical protein ACI837_000211 [Crocinitomicaceae bacterium]|jgi:hypothetical protein